jgi:4'-phosphopantetheinyl transferase
MTMNVVDSLAGLLEIHVWAVRLTASAAVNRVYRILLSDEEIARADRFAFEHLRHSYELSHGALRLLLAHYLERGPRDIKFTFGPRGKPAVQDSRIRFNMAHSSGLALYAFTRDCDIGVDVEEIRSIPEIEQIAVRYFCRPEASEVLSIDDVSARHEAFFRCWTRKEAYIKAVGDGLYLPLDQFQVTLLPGDGSRFVHIGNDIGTARNWTLQHLDPAPRYVGALAYKSESRHVVLHELAETQQLLCLIGRE